MQVAKVPFAAALLLALGVSEPHAAPEGGCFAHAEAVRRSVETLHARPSSETRGITEDGSWIAPLCGHGGAGVGVVSDRPFALRMEISDGASTSVSYSSSPGIPAVFCADGTVWLWHVDGPAFGFQQCTR